MRNAQAKNEVKRDKSTQGYKLSNKIDFFSLRAFAEVDKHKLWFLWLHSPEDKRQISETSKSWGEGHLLGDLMKVGP